MILPKLYRSEIYRTPAQIKTRAGHLRLDKNEYLPCWPDGAFQEFLKTLKPEHLSMHPEIGRLYRKIEKTLKLPRSHIVVTAGSDAAIKAAFEAFVEPGDQVIIPNPTFAMYRIYAEVYNATLAAIDYDRDLHLNVDKLINRIDSSTRLIAIANPNSPTGTVIPTDRLREIISKASEVGAVVLIDEAYYPFYEETLLGDVLSYDNLIVTRTFSKAAGLAGMRVGMLFSNETIAKIIFAAKPMYEITSISAMLAEYVLDNYSMVHEYAQAVRETKEELVDYFQSRGFDVFQGHANFIHVDFGHRTQDIVAHLAKQDVLLTTGFEHVSLSRFTRFSVGGREYMKRLTDLMDDLTALEDLPSKRLGKT